MKRFVLASLATLAVVAAMGSANAADLPRRHAMPAKAPAYAAPYNWTGFYVGINGGGGFGSSTWSNPAGTTGVRTSGGLVGGTLGYNYQIDQLVLGLEGESTGATSAAARRPASAPAPRARPATTGSPPRAAASATPSTASCPYVTGGAAFGDIKTTLAGFGSPDHHQGRLDRSAAASNSPSPARGPPRSNISMSISARAAAGAVCGVRTDATSRTNIVRAGINYRF